MKLLIITAVAVVAGFVLAPSCKKANLLDENDKSVLVDSTQYASIRVIHNFAGNTPQLPTAPNSTTGPQIFLYANGKKLNGAAISYSGTWPVSNVYGIVPPGTVKFEVVMARLNLALVPTQPAPIAGDTLLTVNQTFQAGKYYSLYFGDSVGTYRLTAREDVMPTPAYQTYKLRIANWTMNPLDTFNLYSRRQQGIVSADVAHKQVSDWVQIDLPIISDTLEVRRKGSTAIIGAVLPFSPAGLRFYTVVVRGKNGVTNKAISSSIVTNK